MALLGAVTGLLTAMLRVSKVRFDFERLPAGEDKRILLRAIERSGKAMPLVAALRITRLSPSRYHSWCRAEVGCNLDDQSSCPRMVPTRLTLNEVGAMQEMVESSDHRHMSLRALALHAQRIGKVIASPSTWYVLARKSGWRRSRNRVYPAKPKIGVRASAPNELLHLDVTIIRLLDGTRTYLHAVIDNFSRRILSWALEDRLGSGATCRVLQEAASQISADTGDPIVVADSGSENVNREVDDLLENVDFRRVLAQVEVTFSNSMIEAFWRSLKHSWIYLHRLDTAAALRRLVEFYVTAHNEVMPHSAFEGQTPDEMYFGNGGAVAINLANGTAGSSRRADEDESCGAVWRLYRGGRFNGVAVATPTVQNVVRRSWAAREITRESKELESSASKSGSTPPARNSDVAVLLCVFNYPLLASDFSLILGHVDPLRHSVLSC